MQNPKILQTFQIALQQFREYGKHNKKYLYRNGVKYGQIYYYPRTPDHKDPPVTPAKMFRIQRIKPVKGNPFWEKKLLQEFGLDGPAGQFNVVKNIPEINARLWKIKHLIKVVPITFPHGEPSENDINYTILKENGECIVTKEIGMVEERLNETEKFGAEPNRMDTDLLRKDSRLKWLNPW